MVAAGGGFASGGRNHRPAAAELRRGGIASSVGGGVEAGEALAEAGGADAGDWIVGVAVARGEAAGGPSGGASADPRSGIGSDGHWMAIGINCIYRCNVGFR